MKNILLATLAGVFIFTSFLTLAGDPPIDTSHWVNYSWATPGDNGLLHDTSTNTLWLSPAVTASSGYCYIDLCKNNSNKVTLPAQLRDRLADTTDELYGFSWATIDNLGEFLTNANYQLSTNSSYGYVYSDNTAYSILLEAFSGNCQISWECTWNYQTMFLPLTATSCTTDVPPYCQVGYTVFNPATPKRIYPLDFRGQSVPLTYWLNVNCTSDYDTCRRFVTRIAQPKP